MTPKQEAAMRQALEALEWYVKEDDVCEWMEGNEYWVEGKRNAENAITALREALAEPADEPVEWLHEDELPENYPYDEMYAASRIIDGVRMFPVFHFQPAAQWIGLTDEELTLCHSLAVLSKKHDGTDPSFTTLLPRQIEAKLKEKNT